MLLLEAHIDSALVQTMRAFVAVLLNILLNVLFNRRCQYRSLAMPIPQPCHAELTNMVGVIVIVLKNN